MVIVGSRFKLYLLTLIALALLPGCQTPEAKRKKQYSTLRIHLESKTDTTDRTEQAPIWREHPFTVNVQKVPFLTEANVTQAGVVEVVGGFSLRIQFDHEGALLLEQYSMLNPGKHFAIFSQFVSAPDEKLNNGRWLAAPSITKHITNGVLVFTPDATREESDQIVLGLNNLAKKLEKAPDK
jgi:hypothetical protein